MELLFQGSIGSSVSSHTGDCFLCQTHSLICSAAAKSVVKEKLGQALQITQALPDVKQN